MILKGLSRNLLSVKRYMSSPWHLLRTNFRIIFHAYGLCIFCKMMFKQIDCLGHILSNTMDLEMTLWWIIWNFKENKTIVIFCSPNIKFRCIIDEWTMTINLPIIFHAYDLCIFNKIVFKQVDSLHLCYYILSICKWHCDGIRIQSYSYFSVLM